MSCHVMSRVTGLVTHLLGTAGCLPSHPLLRKRVGQVSAAAHQV